MPRGKAEITRNHTTRVHTVLYLKAASLWLHTELRVDVPIVNPMTQKIVQPFHNSITQALKWGMPKPKQELYTHQMLETFGTQAWTLLQQNSQNQLSRFLAVFDWVHLGLFTGSRGIEYCQTLTKWHEVDQIPLDAVARAHAGEPHMFIRSDFCFLSAMDMIITIDEALAKPYKVIELQILFHFDKSLINSCWQNF